MRTSGASIVEVKLSGVVYARETSNKMAGFAFGKLTGYRGESADELIRNGLIPGAKITIVYDDRDAVQSVTLFKDFLQ